MIAMTRDDAVAALNALQDRLDEAALRGRWDYDRAFQESPTGIGMHEIDIHKTILRVNPEELRLLGYSEREMVGHPVFDFIVMQGVSQRSVDKKLSGTGELKPFVRAFKRKDESAVTMLLLDRHIHNSVGEIIGIRTTMTQIAAATGPDHR